MDGNRRIVYDYIVGAEKSLGEVLKNVDMEPLLRSAVSDAEAGVVLQDSKGHILCQYGVSPAEGTVILKKPVYLEGEAAGHIIVRGKEEDLKHLGLIGEFLFNAFRIIVQCNYKSLLASETHKTVVSQSYEELLETNRQLKISEIKYRDLAEGLEKKVQDRTEELKQAHAKLLQQEKIASVGQLAAGVAHEINNPLGFIISNINTLKQYVSRMKNMLVFYRDAAAETPPEKSGDVSVQKWKELKLEYILTDIDALMKESLDGAERVKKIVSDLKGFSHVDTLTEIEVDINREIDRTLNVLTHEIPDDAEIVRDYHSLPLFTCNPAHICQAFFNIVLNALQARDAGLKLTVTTRSINGSVRIDFSDNGPGIPETIKNRIFEPFFSTKAVGKGTGMGLNVTYEIVSFYRGAIDVQSEEGKGTTFSIVLPLTNKRDNVQVR